ncbi:MAG: type II toxin-antitoxin system PemK/MazF family toxin [bacterium]
MNRGDVYSCRFDPTEGSEQSGIRPAVIVSRTSMNSIRRTVMVVPVTSNLARRAPFHAALSRGDGGLLTDSVALADQLRTVSKERLGRSWGTLSPAAMLGIDEALRVALDL